MALEMAADTPEGREMIVRLTTLRTTLGAIERAMMMYEDLLEDCQMQEEEACQEETSPEEPEEESTDMEMADDEGHGDPGPSDLCEEADVLPLRTRALPLRCLAGMSSPPRRMPSSCSHHHNLKVQSLDPIAPGVRLVQSQGKWLG